MKTRNGLFADVPENLWNDWHWQVANRAETVEDLKKYMTLTPDEEEGVRKTLGKLRMAVTPYYLSLIDLNDPFDPIRKMAIPRAEELEYADYEDADPLHEDTDSPTLGPGDGHLADGIKGIVQVDQGQIVGGHGHAQLAQGLADTLLLVGGQVHVLLQILNRLSTVGDLPMPVIPQIFGDIGKQTITSLHICISFNSE